jgi:hypothetical protein
VVAPVRHGPLVPERRPATTDRVEKRRIPGHPEVGILLARERRPGQVLGRRRGSHRDRPGAESAVCLERLCCDRFRYVGRAKTLRRTLRLARVDPGHVGCVGICLGGEDEPVGYRKAGRDQFAEVGTFAASDRAVGSAEGAQRPYQPRRRDHRGKSYGRLPQTSSTRRGGGPCDV